MKSPSKQASVVIISLVLVATILYGASLYWITVSDSYCARMTTEGNFQTDVLVPFILQHRLSQYPPDKSANNDFRSYLDTQIALKRLGKADAEGIIDQFQTAGQPLPIYQAPRGWVMPLIAKSF